MSDRRPGVCVVSGGSLNCPPRYVPIEVPFAGKATHPQYGDRRAEMWFEMRSWLTSGGAIPNNASLKQELATPIYWFYAVGRKVVELKEKIKHRLQGGASPDIGDALALTFASPVAPRRSLFEVPRGQRQPREYAGSGTTTRSRTLSGGAPRHRFDLLWRWDRSRAPAGVCD